MTKRIDGYAIKKVLLEIVRDLSSQSAGYVRPFSMDSRHTLELAAERLGITLRGEGRDLDLEQALLTVWHDLFRTGHLAWGYGVFDPDPPSYHITEQGRKALENLSRDPANPDGYLTYLSNVVSLNPIALSYLKEALKTYNSDCFKATAVMVGAAAESIVLELRDVLVDRMASPGKTLPRNLKSWKVKQVIDSLKKELEPQKSKMPNNLREAFEAYWPAFTQQIRAARNEAGHPTSIDPVTPETVHASLLIFPELAKLASDLKRWVSLYYTRAPNQSLQPPA
ncbi:MAG: hypothetical protein U9R11_01630 [Chloroflexota bacterium]|nr:hypothetical protein [Chloroflexota bacterium]